MKKMTVLACSLIVLNLGAETISANDSQVFGNRNMARSLSLAISKGLDQQLDTSRRYFKIAVSKKDGVSPEKGKFVADYISSIQGKIDQLESKLLSIDLEASAEELKTNKASFELELKDLNAHIKEFQLLDSFIPETLANLEERLEFVNGHDLGINAGPYTQAINANINAVETELQQDLINSAEVSRHIYTAEGLLNELSDFIK